MIFCDLTSNFLSKLHFHSSYPPILAKPNFFVLSLHALCPSNSLRFYITTSSDTIPLNSSNLCRPRSNATSFKQPFLISLPLSRLSSFIYTSVGITITFRKVNSTQSQKHNFGDRELALNPSPAAFLAVLPWTNSLSFLSYSSCLFVFLKNEVASGWIS